MKILVDLTNCKRGESYWIYASRILAVWKDYKSSDVAIMLLIKAEAETLIQTEFPEFEYMVLKQFSYRNKWQRLFRIKWIVDGLMWRKTVNRSQCDALFVPGSFFIFFWKVKMYKLLVMHDIQGLRTWAGGERLRCTLFTPLLLMTPDRIITISDFVKQDILKTYPFIPSNKITVIYNGVVLPALSSSVGLKIDYKYMLYISTLCEYKNVVTLVKSFIELKDQIPHKLVIVGKTTPYWETVMMPIIKKADIEDRIVHLSHYVSDEDIAYLYHSADIFISPSLHEGFGYTPIEAAVCGTPVICTKETALPEVTMGLVNYYEPALDSIALKNKIMEVLENYPTEEHLKMISDTFKSRYDNVQQARKIYDCVVKYAERNKIDNKIER